MWVAIVLLCLGAIGLVFYLLEKCRRYSLRGVLIKSMVSLLFVALAAYSAWYNGGHSLNAFIVIGLVLGLLGDIWLDLKYVYPKDDKLYSYAGFAVFGAGHILYVVGMYLEFFGDANALYLVLPLVGAVALAFGNLLMSKPLNLDYGSMKWVVVAYAATLFSTPLCALSLCILHSFQVPSLTLLFVGGILFAISDLVLSGTYFGKGHEKPLDFILNYVTYYPAQFLIAFSLFFL